MPGANLKGFLRRFTMSRIGEQVCRERSQYQVIVGLSIGVVGLATVLQSSDPLIFPRFIGRTHPLIAVPLVSALGIVLLSLLLGRGWFNIYKPEHLKWLWRCSALGALFAVVTVALDLKVVFPADINVAFPAALLFYPAIGFVVEIVFHVLPLSVLLVAGTAMTQTIGPRRVMVMAIAIVSLLEPVFQTMPMAASHHYPIWAVVFLGMHLSAFNGFQLLIFRRYDFLTMYAARLGYYLVWHIVWGQLRLQILF